MTIDTTEKHFLEPKQPDTTQLLNCIYRRTRNLVVGKGVGTDIVKLIIK